MWMQYDRSSWKWPHFSCHLQHSSKGPSHFLGPVRAGSSPCTAFLTHPEKDKPQGFFFEWASSTYCSQECLLLRCWSHQFPHSPEGGTVGEEMSFSGCKKTNVRNSCGGHCSCLSQLAIFLVRVRKSYGAGNPRPCHPGRGNMGSPRGLFAVSLISFPMTSWRPI